LIIYDIPRDIARNLLSGNKFRAFKKILEELGATRLQHSVYIVDTLDKAKKIRKFIGHGYCRVFKVIEEV